MFMFSPSNAEAGAGGPSRSRHRHRRHFRQRFHRRWWNLLKSSPVRVPRLHPRQRRWYLLPAQPPPAWAFVEIQVVKLFNTSA